MSFYRPYIIALIMLGLLLLAAISDKKQRIKGWHYTLCLLLILSTFFLGRDQTASDIAFYDRIYASNKISVTDGSTTHTLSFSSDGALEDPYRHAGEKPVRASQNDLTQVAELSFISAAKNSTVTLALCKTDNAGNYPEDRIWNYQGTNYCLLTKKFLYRNAFVYLEKDHAAQLLEQVLSK